MLTSNLPFSGNDQKEIATQIISKEPDFKNKVLSHLSKNAIDFLQSKNLIVIIRTPCERLQ
jgi:hypothetical protein